MKKEIEIERYIANKKQNGRYKSYLIISYTICQWIKTLKDDISTKEKKNIYIMRTTMKRDIVAVLTLEE